MPTMICWRDIFLVVVVFLQSSSCVYLVHMYSVCIFYWHIYTSMNTYLSILVVYFVASASGSNRTDVFAVQWSQTNQTFFLAAKTTTTTTAPFLLHILPSSGTFLFFLLFCLSLTAFAFLDHVLCETSLFCILEIKTLWYVMIVPTWRLFIPTYFTSTAIN